MNETAPADTNPYAAPEHLGSPVAAVGPQRFYVVSAAKFLVLYISTVGLYGYYWYYRHWANIRRASQGSEWPVARAIFSVFFVHQLVEEIELRLRRDGTQFAWKPNGTANAIVLLAILGWFLGRASGSQEEIHPSDFAVFALVPVAGLVKLKAQRAANAACGDALGAVNSSFGVGSILAVVLGGLFWLLMAAAGAIMVSGQAT